MKSAIYTFKKIGYILFFGYGWLLIALIFIISTNNRKYFLEILDKKSKGIPTTEEDLKWVGNWIEMAEHISFFVWIFALVWLLS